MIDAVSAFTSAKMTRALRGAARADKHVLRATIFADNSIELVFLDQPPIEIMTQEQLRAALAALPSAEPDEAT